RRSRTLDRALSLPDLARLSAPAQSLDAIGARTASARHGFSSWARPSARPPHAGTAVRIGALEGRYAGPCRQRGAAGRHGRGQQHLIWPLRRYCWAPATGIANKRMRIWTPRAGWPADPKKRHHGVAAEFRGRNLTS